MIYVKAESSKYKDEFMKKFTNFGEKAPILLSFACDDFGVTVVHENTGNKYFYAWDFTVPIKSFIHSIKQDLSQKHYPRIIKVEEVTRSIKPDEMANLIEKGTDTDHIPATVTETIEHQYIIDKIIAMKDEFILIDVDTREQFCYRMDSSGIFYLRNYRTGKYKSLEEAGEEFFKRSTLIGQLENV